MEQKLIITIDEDKKDSVENIIEALKENGVDVTKVYSYGVLVAKGDSNKMAQLRSIEGIQEITFEPGIQLPPPDADIQ